MKLFKTTPGYCRNLYSFCMKAGPNYNFVYQVTEESFLDVVVGNNFLLANNALKNIYLFIHPFIHSFKYIFIRLLPVSFLIHLYDNLFTYLFNGVYIHLLSEVLYSWHWADKQTLYVRTNRWKLKGNTRDLGKLKDTRKINQAD